MVWDSNLFNMKEPNVKGSRPWAFTLTPQLCLLFLKDFIGRFWGKSLSLIASHGFLIWHWQDKNFAQSHPPTPSHPSHVALLANTTMLVQGGSGDVMAS